MLWPWPGWLSYEDLIPRGVHFIESLGVKKQHYLKRIQAGGNISVLLSNHQCQKAHVVGWQ